MRKPYFLLSMLAAITSAHAGLVIEPEATPAYIPYATAAPVATPAPSPVTVPAPSLAPQGKLQQVLAQPVVADVPTNDQAKKLLAEDAAKAINAPPAKVTTTPNKQLDASTTKPATGTPVPATASKPLPTALDAAKPAQIKEQVAEIKSDVVEVKPSVEAEPLPSWSAAAGSTLRQTIQEWTQREGWDVRWESELLDYPIEEKFSMVGKYLDVVTRTFELYKDARRPFKVEIYPSQKLVVVKEKK